MRTYTRHYVTEMDESNYQRCIYCGEMICDNRRLIGPIGSPPSPGWPEGHVFVSQAITMIAEPDEPDQFKPCQP